MSRPLQGLTIIDMTRLLPGPAATMHLVDFGADDRLAIGQGLNGLGTLDVEGLVERIDDLGGDAWLDLGGGNGVLFLGVGGDELAGLLETNVVFI